MAAEIPKLQDILERLERVERQNRKLSGRALSASWLRQAMGSAKTNYAGSEDAERAIRQESVARHQGVLVGVEKCVASSSRCCLCSFGGPS